METLEELYNTATRSTASVFVTDNNIRSKIHSICRCNSNRAPIRFLLSAILAKMDDNNIDMHRPYTSMGERSYAGRTYDENIVQPFIHKYALPCNATTAYLTPAFRTISEPIIKSIFNKCRPKEVYYEMVEIIDYLDNNHAECRNALLEMLSELHSIKEENEKKISQYLSEISNKPDSIELSSDEILTLLSQHLQCNNSSRLPVLMITAAYLSVTDLIKEKPLPLNAHNAADSQTKSLGDVEITLANEDAIVTCYEMKKKKVSIDDIYVCAVKISKISDHIDNYIIITTDIIEQDVADLAKTFYNSIGVEIAVLDCLGFIKHFLHFFHRRRSIFLNHYQKLVIEEPESAVSQPLKEAFLALRKVAESEK